MPFIKRNDVEIYFETHGQGTPFMFFSETACAGDVWNIFQVPEFGRDHMVITHDHPGTGRSTKPTLQYSTEDFVDDAAAILDHLNAGPAILCGHSMGGRIIQLLALKYPAKVKEMIIASSGAGHPGMAKGIPSSYAKKWSSSAMRVMCEITPLKLDGPEYLDLSNLPVKPTITFLLIRMRSQGHSELFGAGAGGFAEEHKRRPFAVSFETDLNVVAFDERHNGFPSRVPAVQLRR
jgi:pimeloyl-ACP methyl ester carboxylesterase